MVYCWQRNNWLRFYIQYLIRVGYILPIQQYRYHLFRDTATFPEYFGFVSHMLLISDLLVNMANLIILYYYVASDICY